MIFLPLLRCPADIDTWFSSNHWSIVCSDVAESEGTTTLDLFETIVEAGEKSALFGPM